MNGAGHDTTKLALGWAAQLLAEHPDQRRILVDDPSLIPGAFEEILRYEPPTMQSCRWTSVHVEVHGQTIPEGSIVALVGVAANRDERRFPDPDRFDVRRTGAHHLSFGFGAHYCLGASLVAPRRAASRSRSSSSDSRSGTSTWSTRGSRTRRVRPVGGSRCLSSCPERQH